MHEDRLDKPLRWRDPKMIFVDSMSDLFHEAIPFDFIDKVFAVAAQAPRHTFQILTKRAERMAEYLNDRRTRGRISWQLKPVNPSARSWTLPDWPFANIWLGVSVENQKTADQRIPHLLRCPAAVRWISAEPLLERITLRRHKPFLAFMGAAAVECEHGHDACPICDRGIDWVVAGGESGPGARMCDVAWLRALGGECSLAHIPFHVKQLGSRAVSSKYPETKGCRCMGVGEIHGPGFIRPCPSCSGLLEKAHLKGSGKRAKPEEWPEDLRVQEWPVQR